MACVCTSIKKVGFILAKWPQEWDLKTFKPIQQFHLYRWHFSFHFISTSRCSFFVILLKRKLSLKLQKYLLFESVHWASIQVYVGECFLVRMSFFMRVCACMFVLNTCKTINRKTVLILLFLSLYVFLSKIESSLWAFWVWTSSCQMPCNDDKIM